MGPPYEPLGTLIWQFSRPRMQWAFYDYSLMSLVYAIQYSENIFQNPPYQLPLYKTYPMPKALLLKVWIVEPVNYFRCTSTAMTCQGVMSVT